MKNRKMSRLSKMVRSTFGAAGVALACAGSAHAATVSDNLVNTATVVDSCYVVATGIDFGVVTTPMVADIPGALPNVADTGTIAITVLGQTVNVLTVSQPGVDVVCSTTPSSIQVTLGGGATYDLKNTPVTGSPAIDGKLTGPGGAQINYTMGFAGVSTPALLNGVVAAYAGVFAVNPLTTKIPMQTLSGGAGVYTDTATVTVTY